MTLSDMYRSQQFHMQRSLILIISDYYNTVDFCESRESTPGLLYSFSLCNYSAM